MKIDKTTAVAFSGHRTFKMSGAPRGLFDGAGGHSPEAIAERLRQTVRMLAGEGYRSFLCGMAEGFDMMAAEAVLELRGEFPGMELVAVQPFPGQASGFGQELQERYRRVLDSAAQVVTVCPHYSADCFHRRNDLLVDHSSVLVCYYNGTKGGTAYTVKRALRAGLRVMNLA